MYYLLFLYHVILLMLKNCVHSVHAMINVYTSGLKEVGKVLIMFYIMLTINHKFVSVHCHANEYWVRPNITVDCPESVSTDNCVTLPDIAANNSRFFASNTAMYFLHGEHYITSDEDIWIGMYDNQWLEKHTYNVSLEAVELSNVMEKQSAIINCRGTKVGFSFVGVANLSLSRLMITNCGFDITKYPLDTRTFSDIWFISPVYTSLYLDSVTNAAIRDVVVTWSTGYGLLGLSLGDLKINGCSFKYNGRKVFYPNGTVLQSPGGNVILHIDQDNAGIGSVTVLNSIFAHGLVLYNEPYIQFAHGNFFPFSGQSAGLTIELSGKMYKIVMDNCIFYNNTAPVGANMLVRVYEPGRFEFQIDPTKLNVIRCSFSNGFADEIGGGIYIDIIDKEASRYIISFSNTTFNNNIARNKGGAIAVRTTLSYPNIKILIHGCTLNGNTAEFGGAFFAKIKFHARLTEIRRQFHHRITFSVYRSVFTFNKALRDGGAVYATSLNTTLSRTVITFIDYDVKKSIFSDNTAEMGSAMWLSSQNNLEKNINLSLMGCLLIHNYHDVSILSNKRIHKTGSVLYTNQVHSIFVRNTRIANNNCRGIFSTKSTIEVGENVWITNNTAPEGAGILLDYSSAEDTNKPYLLLSNASLLYIHDNRALNYGGGIAIKTAGGILQQCFFDLQNNRTKPALYLSGNTAGIAGSAIYEGNLENCRMESSKETLTARLFWTTFNISERNTLSAVASQPFKVCICSSNFSTTQSCSFDYKIEVYPGQTFSVPAVAVGQYNYSSNSPSVSRAVIAHGYSAQLGEQQVTQDVSLSCKNLTYSLRTQENEVIIQLLIEIPFNLDMTVPELQQAIVNVSILSCPFGFELYESSQKCDCIRHLAKQGVTCDIANQVMHRSASMWIGNFSEDIVVHSNCPFDYCNQTVTEISPYNQSKQCGFNRFGVLCGACQPGFSLVLGTSICKKCSNVYLLLTLPMVLAGFVLVVLLLKCNLTVSTGTLNGLIFYANIIQVNNKVFFPPGSDSISGNILPVFIAWINLDLGFEACFVDGLKTYDQTWLQFVFPIYIWLLVGLLIIVCRYSTTISMLTGSNTVSVLATLFLLSYAKLLRTTLNAFSPITITDHDNTAHLRWLLDGNYGFLHWPHLALFLAGLLTLVVHLIPFTGLVLLGPTMQAHTDYRVLGWVTRFKPFLDAYQGPYKTRYRYWTGLMLLVRVFLFAVFAGNALGDPNVNLLTISLTILILLIAWVKIGRVYRKSPLNGLELFYLMNLEIIAMATLYLRATSDTNTQQQILSLIMAGSVLIVFTSTLIYHCYSEVIKTNIGKKLQAKAQGIWSSRQHRANIGETIGPGQEEGENQSQAELKSPTRTVVCLKELKESLLNE